MSITYLQSYLLVSSIKNRFRVMSFILLLRKTVYIVILLTLVSLPSKIPIIMLTSIQVIFTIYLIFLRPYTEIKWNLLEIINEIYFLFLLGSLIFLNTEVDWNRASKITYIWFLTSNNMIVGSIVICKFRV